MIHFKAIAVYLDTNMDIAGFRICETFDIFLALVKAVLTTASLLSELHDVIGLFHNSTSYKV